MTTLFWECLCLCAHLLSTGLDSLSVVRPMHQERPKPNILDCVNHRILPFMSKTAMHASAIVNLSVIYDRQVMLPTMFCRESNNVTIFLLEKINLLFGVNCYSWCLDLNIKHTTRTHERGFFLMAIYNLLRNPFGQLPDNQRRQEQVHSGTSIWGLCPDSPARFNLEWRLEQAKVWQSAPLIRRFLQI